MKPWQIEYWNEGGKKNPIEKWLDKLTQEQFKSIDKEITLLRKIGNELTLPHSRSLGKGLFELRERRFGFRIYYCFLGQQIIILLAAGDKKTQTNDIKLARERLATLGEQ